MTRVLIVVHDPAERDRIALTLRQARFEVRSSAHTTNALKIIQDDHPSVALFAPCALDVPLADFCQSARVAGNGHALSIIALLPSGQETVQEIRAAIHASASDAIRIDCDQSELTAAVSACAARLAAMQPHTVTESVTANSAAIEESFAAMVRPSMFVSLELEDAATLAAADGTGALLELDRVWQARLRALILEQALLFPISPGQAIVLLPGSTPDPRTMLAMLSGTGQPPVVIGNHTLRLRAALGIYRLAVSDPPPAAGFAAARSYFALQQARNGPQPHIQLYESSIEVARLEEAATAALLQHALEQGAFRLVYQPKVSIETGRMVGVEALIRWTLPTTGEPVPAVRLLAIAERAGLLDEIGSWALREACRQCADWSRAGADVPVSVNIAPSQFRRGDLEDEVRLALSEAGLPGRLLTLEVQEGMLQHADDDMALQLQAIRVTGVRICVDDFGTGIASIAVMRKLAIDELKIDQTVIARLPGAAEDRATLDTALRHAKQLGIECVAEGIERAEQWAFLAERGWHSAQGWLISHPLAGTDVPAFARRNPAALATASGSTLP